MIYLMLQMVGILLIASACGALLLWLVQALWGRFLAPMRTRTLELDLDGARSDLISQEQRIHALEREVHASEQRVEALQRAKRQLTATLDSRNRALHEATEQLSAIAAEANPRPSESPESLRKELRVAVTERDEALGKLREAEARNERLRTELEVLHGIHERMLDDIERLKARVRETELELRTSGESRPPAWLMAQPFGARDDLQRLEGVDPMLERALNRLGIYHFHQIARFEPTDVEWLVEHLDGIPEQTIRDSWIPDASQLAGTRGN